MNRKSADDRQLTLDSLFAIPAVPGPGAGNLDYGIELRQVMAAMLKRSPLDRYDLAARMSKSLNRDITKGQIDGWIAESRENWHFPLEYATAWEEALGMYDLIELHARKRGCKVYVGEDVYKAELGKLEVMKDEITHQIKLIKQHMEAKR